MALVGLGCPDLTTPQGGTQGLPRVRGPPGPGDSTLKPPPASSAAVDVGGRHPDSRRVCGPRAGRTGRCPRARCLRRQGRVRLPRCLPLPLGCHPCKENIYSVLSQTPRQSGQHQHRRSSCWELTLGPGCVPSAHLGGHSPMMTTGRGSELLVLTWSLLGLLMAGLAAGLGRSRG